LSEEGEMEARALAYAIEGQGDPVVLVPGGLTGWVSLIPHAERLSTKWRTVRVQPIHNELGSAGRPGDPTYTAEIERESLRMTMDALRVESAHFAGWSAGGKALIEFALAYPERVRTLTLVEPAAHWILEQLDDEDSDLLRDARRANDFMHGLFGRNVTEDDLTEFLETAGLAPSKEDARKHPNWERWVPHRMTLSWYSEDYDRSERSIKELVGIRCPTLLIKGTVGTDADRRVVDVLGEPVPNVTVIELPGDHACHVESIDAFLDAFDRQLASA
jgi:pimeloyl-ACP methyl ester carboxylesterase